MKFLFLDYETRSLLNLEVVGLDNYAKHPSTEILMLAYAFDDGEPHQWFPHLGPIPEKLLKAMKDPKVLKVSWNAAFERTITLYKLGFYISLNEWRDPMSLVHMISLPGKLDDAAPILHLKETKDARGEELIHFFCEPVSMGGEETLFGIAPPLFHDWDSHPQEWKEFCEYNVQDIRAEREPFKRISKLPGSNSIWEAWQLDQKINEFGMPTNRDLAQKGLQLALRYVDEKKKELATVTGMANNSDQKILPWARERGYPWGSLRKEFVQAELDNKESPLTKQCREALLIRRETRKSSYKKIERLLSVLSEDDRLRFQFHYMGASRTGRWAGEDVQVQNLLRPDKNVKKNLDLALKLIGMLDYDGIKAAFPKTSVVGVVSSCMRSFFQAGKGKKIVVADLNAIENRVLGWVADEQKILDVFRKGQDPYMAFGVYLYGIPYEQWIKIDEYGNHKPKDAQFEEMRQNSKPPVLGGGYALGGGEEYTNEFGDVVRGGLWGYAKNVCGVDMPKELAHKAVKILRDEWKKVVQLWADLEEAFKQVLKGQKKEIRVGEVTWDRRAKRWVEHPSHGKGCVLVFRRHRMAGEDSYMIEMQLPSGRSLYYLRAFIEEEEAEGVSQRTGEKYKYTREILYYEGIEHSAVEGSDGRRRKGKAKWGKTKTYGGKLTENAVQAISRDILVNGMILTNEMGMDIFGLFHDEIATEVEDSPFAPGVRDLIWCMSQVPDWAPGLILGAEGYEAAYYKKG